jgi:hypothetical protein
MNSEPSELPGWRAMNADTDSWAEEIRLRYFRQAPASKKLEMASELTSGMLMLAKYHRAFINELDTIHSVFFY